MGLELFWRFSARNVRIAWEYQPISCTMQARSAALLPFVDVSTAENFSLKRTSKGQQIVDWMIAQNISDQSIACFTQSWLAESAVEFH